MPATMKAIVTDGPDRSAIAAAVRTNSPAPMIAPMPRATSDVGPSVRFSACSPPSAASPINCSIGFVPKSDIGKGLSTRLYQAVQILADPAGRVARRQQIRYHGDRRRACPHHVTHVIEG